MDYVFDNAIWTDDVRILTDDTLIVPGLEMFGHNCSARNLRLLTPHIHKTAEFLYLANGSQKYSINGQEYTVKGNQVLVVDAEVPHSSGPNPYGRYESLWFRLDIAAFAANLGVSEPVRELICQRLQRMTNPILVPQDTLYNELQNAFYSLASSDPTEQLSGYGKFVHFVTQLVKCTDPTGGYSPGIQRVITYIEENICTHLGLEELAELAGLSLSGFKQKFRRETGITPREYINLLKIEKAKALLRAGSSVTETAFSLDFSSSSYFSVLFKQMEDMSPSEYVRLHGKKQSEL